MSTNRTITDGLLTKTQALPAANANNSTAAIDLEQKTLFPVNEEVDLQISVPATPDLANTTTITFTIQDSADGSSFAAVAGLGTLVVTGATANPGGLATSRAVKLPGYTRRYVRVNAAVANGGGDNTAVSYTMRLLA